MRMILPVRPGGGKTRITTSPKNWTTPRRAVDLGFGPGYNARPVVSGAFTGKFPSPVFHDAFRLRRGGIGLTKQSPKGIFLRPPYRGVGFADG
jgi:hypothetical protein